MPRRKQYILLRQAVINEKYYTRILIKYYNGSEIILQHILSDYRSDMGTNYYEYFHQWNYKKREEVQADKHFDLILKGYFGKAEPIV